jgi:hypothetical protein
MGASIPIVEGYAHIKREKIDGAWKFQWNCSCISPQSWPQQSRKSQWHRNVSTVVEAFRQHWCAAHPDLDTSDWDYVHNRIAVWATETSPNDWQKRELFAQLYGAKATVQITNLNTGATVTGAATSFNYTEKEEKVGMSRFEDIQARLRELEKEAAKYARFERVDPWPVGTVVVYDQEATTGEKYTYAVLKCGNEKWYWTGHGVFTKSGASYDHLVEHLAHDRTSNIRVAVPDDFKPLFSETTEEPTTPVAKDAAPESTGVFIPRLSEK